LGLSGVHLEQGPLASAGDITSYLKDLYQSDLFTDEQRQYVMNLLLHQKFRAGIPAGITAACAGECTVYNKTGDVGTARNDTAIVEYGEGRAYAITILTDGASYGDIASLSTAVHQAIIQ
jgi:hypothetical protein